MLQSCMSTSAPPPRWSPSVVAQIPTDKGSALVTKTSAINAVISNAIVFSFFPTAIQIPQLTAHKTYAWAALPNFIVKSLYP